MGSLTFLNSGFLYGVAGVLIPVLLYWFLRQKTKRVVFGSVWFLRNAAKRVAHRRRWAEVLLLILRGLILALLAIAFARPFFVASGAKQGGGAAGFGARRVRAMAVLVDVSASMAAGQRMETARKRALGALDRLRQGDMVAVYAFSGQLEPVVPWTADIQQARRAVESLKNGYGGTDLSGALRRVNEEMIERHEPDREVVAISDMQAPGWKEYRGDWKMSQAVALTLEDVANEEGLDNVALERIELPSQVVAGRQPAALTAQLWNGSGTEQKVLVSLIVDGRAADSNRVSVLPRARQSVVLQAAFTNAGWRTGKIEFKKEDGLTLDNERWFSVLAQPRMRVVIVSAGKREDPREDGGFYLARAFGLAGESSFQVEAVDSASWKPTSLDGVGLVVISEAGTLQAQALKALKGYADKGGGILFFAGADDDPREFNRQFADLAPCLLASKVDAAELTGRSDGVGLGDVQYQHRLMKVFAQARLAGFSRARFRQYWKVTDVQASQVLARFQSGAPALLFKENGASKSVLLATGANLKMGDFPQSVAFVPFLHETAKTLSVSQEATAANVVVGADVVVEIPGDAAAPKLVKPSGAEAKPELTAGGTGPGSLRFRAVEQGIYKLMFGSNTMCFAANIPSSESDLSRIKTDEVAAALTSRRGKETAAAVRIEARKPEGEQAEKAQRLGARLLWLILALLIVEMIVSDRIVAAEAGKE